MVGREPPNGNSGGNFRFSVCELHTFLFFETKERKESRRGAVGRSSSRGRKETSGDP